MNGRMAKGYRPYSYMKNKNNPNTSLGSYSSMNMISHEEKDKYHAKLKEYSDQNIR